MDLGQAIEIAILSFLIAVLIVLVAHLMTGDLLFKISDSYMLKNKHRLHLKLVKVSETPFHSELVFKYDIMFNKFITYGSLSVSLQSQPRGLKNLTTQELLNLKEQALIKAKSYLEITIAEDEKKAEYEKRIKDIMD